jgi:DNA-3-methyladenine glycosylase
MLPDALLNAPALTLARDLLGSVLASDIGGERASGIIVETEAYLGIEDPASHAWRGTRRKGQHGIWAAPGTWYVYRSYGMHWCLNLTAGPEGQGAAVLIRAIEPLEGLAVMRRRRGAVPDRHLADGPGKLTAALAISDLEDGVRPGAGVALRLEPRPADANARRTIVVTPRIGISRATEWPLRYLLQRTQ